MKKLVCCVFCLICILLILFHDVAAAAAREAFVLWTDAVLPSLLPFFVCVTVLKNHADNSALYPLMALSAISGAPSGARLLGALDMPLRERSIWCAALNNVSPVFILGVFCGGLLGLPVLIFPICLSILLSAALVLALLRPQPPRAAPSVQEENSGFFHVFSGAIVNSMAAMLSICANLVFFMVLLSLIERACGALSGLPGALMAGSLEMVNGAYRAAGAGLSLRATAGLGAWVFSFGGLCIYSQSAVFAALDFKTYWGCKLLQSLLAALFSFLLTPLFISNASQVFFAFDDNALALRNAGSAAAMLTASAVGAGITLVYARIMRYRTKTAPTKSSGSRSVP